jgi:3-keto-L-gulonate-6-phosphate decarboxylase
MYCLAKETIENNIHSMIGFINAQNNQEQKDNIDYFSTYVLAHIGSDNMNHIFY